MDEDLKKSEELGKDDSEKAADSNTEDPAKPNERVDLKNDPALEAELAEANNRYLRLQADFSNFRRRIQKEKEDLLLNANLELIRSLLPVLDSLDKAEEQGDTGTVQVFKQFNDILAKEGLEKVDALDKPFDPNFHQALDSVESDAESGIIVEELRKGYTFRGILIRPSMVRVAK